MFNLLILQSSFLESKTILNVGDKRISAFLKTQITSQLYSRSDIENI